MKTLWSVVIAIVITGVVAVFVTWYFTKNFAESSNKAPDESTVGIIKTDVSKLKVGDKLGEWTISKIDTYTNVNQIDSSSEEIAAFGNTLSNHNYYIELAGDIEVIGNYRYLPTSEFTGEANLYLEVFDDNNLVKIPSIDINIPDSNSTASGEEVRTGENILLNKDLVSKMLGITLGDKVLEGSATFKLNKLYLAYYTESMTKADVASVSNVSETPLSTK